MNNLVWKAGALAVVILSCATLVLRAGKTTSSTAANVMSVSPAPHASVNAPPPQFASPCVATIPRSWGQYRGGSSQSGLAFEASDGTLRFITNLPCGATPVVALEVRRTAASSGDSLD
jgi:hypothetical protein